MNKEEGIWRHFGLALVLAIVFYLAFFGWMQRRRTEKGPWKITFRADSVGVPSLLISQSVLHISELIQFTGARAKPVNLSETVQFAEAVSNVPYGRIVFQDPTFLPGTVTLEMFGHRVELLPRVLKLDSREYGWGTPPVIEVR